MRIEIIPEKLIWDYIRAKLTTRGPYSLKEHKVLSFCPDSIDLSEEFLEPYQKIVGVAIRQKLVETFGWRPFLFLQSGEVRQFTLADSEFWNGVSFTFSKRAVDRIWESLIREHKEIKVAWENVTPWDAIFLGILDPGNFENYSFEWLASVEADWLATSFFLFSRKERPQGLPWGILFKSYKSAQLALRGILIEKTGRFFQDLVAAFQNFRAVCEKNPQRSFALFENRFRIDFSNFMAISNSGEFPFKLIEEAFRYWTGEGALGYDDPVYLQSAEKRCRLFHYIELFKSEIHDFQVSIR